MTKKVVTPLIRANLILGLGRARADPNSLARSQVQNFGVDVTMSEKHTRKVHTFKCAPRNGQTPNMRFSQ